MEGFVELPDADPPAFLDYARRFGLLDLCDHGFPYRHPPTEDGETCLPVPLESVERWRTWAVRARAILAVGARLHRDKPGRAGDWAVLAREDWDLGQRVDVDRRVLGRILDGWLHISGARPVVGWGFTDERPTIEIAGDGLFQNIARELALTVGRLDGLAVCDWCGQPYSPDRKPRSDARRIFCEACHESGVPARLRKRDQRARERREGETDG